MPRTRTMRPARIASSIAAAWWPVLAPLALVVAQAGRPRPGGWALAAHATLALAGLVALPARALVVLLTLLAGSLVSPVLSGASASWALVRLLAALLALPVVVVLVRPLHHVTAARLRRRLVLEHREAVTLRELGVRDPRTRGARP